MTIRRASLGLSICASLVLGSAAVAAPAPPSPIPPAPAPAAPIKVSDIGCTAQLLWFINAGRKMAKDPAQPEKDRISAFQTIELLRGALGYFEARLEASPPANRSETFVQEVGKIDNMPSDQRTAHVSVCLKAYIDAEQRVLAGLSPTK